MTDTTREAVARAKDAVIAAARQMPRQTPDPGHASTRHKYLLEAGIVWTLDKALRDLDAALADLRPAQDAEGWRDIASAPKKEAVLIAGGTYSMGSSFFQDEPFTGVTIAWCKDGEWRGDNAGAHDEYYWHKPTHWMPLPASPPRTLEGN